MINRMTFARAALALVLAFAIASVASAQIYRWTDEKGRVHIGDTPPPGARNVEKRASAGAASLPSGATYEPYALQLARKNAPVTLYSTPNCELCNEARALLNGRGVPFKEISVVGDKQVEELKEAVGANAVPSLIVGRSVQQGFEAGTYHRILDAAGYPETGVAPPRHQQEPRAEKPPAKAPAPDQPPSGPYAPGAKRSPKR